MLGEFGEHVTQSKGGGSLPPSARPELLQRLRHVGHPEPDRPPDLEVGDEPTDPPGVELPAADLEVLGKFGLGDQLQFVAQQRSLLVHARGCHVNPDGGRSLPTNSDKLRSPTCPNRPKAKI